jgi:GNAT superfamily N-acetyltransferase
MAYRLPRREFRDGRANDVNKNRMKEVVWNNKPAGMLAFHDGKAIGWCAMAPREDFVRFEKSRVHKRIDDKPVWSIPCLFVHRKFRMKGVSAEILKAVIGYAKQKGIKILEAYPVIPTQERLPDAFAWIGLYSSYEKAGFEVVDRTSRNRPMVRYYTEK